MMYYYCHLHNEPPLWGLNTLRLKAPHLKPFVEFYSTHQKNHIGTRASNAQANGKKIIKT